MKVTLELSTEIDTTSKIGVSYKVSNVKFDNIEVETILDTPQLSKEDAKYATMCEAIAEYYKGLTLALSPLD